MGKVLTIIAIVLLIAGACSGITGFLGALLLVLIFSFIFGSGG